MIKECPMRHENGNCLPAGGFCTAVREITCEALQNAYQMGYMDMGNRAKAEDVVKVVRCKDCIFRNEYNECENTSVKGKYDRNRDYFVDGDFFCADGERKKTE